MGFIRVLLVLALVAGGFAGGFYTGIWYRDEQIREKPEEFLKLMGEDLGEKAREKYEKVKKALLE